MLQALEQNDRERANSVKVEQLESWNVRFTAMLWP